MPVPNCRGNVSTNQIERPTTENTMTNPMQNQQNEIQLPGEILSAYGKILKYPDEEYQEHVREWFEALDDYPEIRSHVQTFIQHVENASLGKLEELFVKTFEMNKKRPLEIGWHLYGEEYKRGQFLVKMRDLLREHGIQENGELPDHLTYCLTVLPGLDTADTEGFVRKYMHPAIDSIIEGFGEDENSYLLVVKSLSMLLEDAYGRSEEE